MVQNLGATGRIPYDLGACYYKGSGTSSRGELSFYPCSGIGFSSVADPFATVVSSNGMHIMCTQSSFAEDLAIPRSSVSRTV